MANIGIDLPSSSSGGSAAIIALLANILAVLTGAERTINTVESLVDGSTPSGVQSMSIYFDGDNGTLDGQPVPNGYVQGFSPNKGDDTIGAMAYTVPNTGNARVIISYINV